jgi:hypothetical protein
MDKETRIELNKLWSAFDSVKVTAYLAACIGAVGVALAVVAIVMIRLRLS